MVGHIADVLRLEEESDDFVGHIYQNRNLFHDDLIVF
jgi:hypothetical protein